MNKLHTTLLAICLAATATTAVAMEEKGHGAMEMKKPDTAMEQGAMRMEHKEDKMMKQDMMEKELTAKEKKALKKKAQEKKMKKDAMTKEDKKMKQERMMQDEKMEHGTMQRMQ